MKSVLIAVCLLFSYSCFAQQEYDISASGVIFKINGVRVKDDIIEYKEGTPYFKRDWLNSTLVLNDGKTYKNMKAKVDILSNRILYIDDKGVELEATSPIKEISLLDPKGGLYHFVHCSSVNASKIPEKSCWFQQLSKGNASAFKVYTKAVSETKAYGSAIAEKSIITTDKHYILYKGVLTQVKKVKEIPSILTEKSKELENFIDKDLIEKDSFDNKLAAIIDYYNSISN